jgi:deoxyribodipyrimidine photo-lyase
MPTAIWWIRRDLRLNDNQALSAALQCADRVVPVFILDPAILTSPYVGDKRVAFLLGGLRELHVALRARGSQLTIRRGEPTSVLNTLVSETSANVIVAEQDHSPYAKERDTRASAHLPLRLVGSPVVHPPGTVLKQDGTPYTVFTPFRNKCKSLPITHEIYPLPAIIPTMQGVAGQDIPAEPSLPPAIPFPPGESEAERRLVHFCEGQDVPIYHYAAERDRIDLNATSQLSPYLRFGMISAHRVVQAALDAIHSAPDGSSRDSAETWLDELIWREFYVAILAHFPEVRQRSFRPALRAVRWENDERAFQDWCTGHTGYPIVDAAMRQLAQSGWMHNRARMIVASFLVKDLLIDWRWGERYFMQHLVDGDPAANNGGWQWTAGTGTDAAPYFRVFNPIIQGTRCDPQGCYVRHWVPELANVPDRWIHAPWKMPGDLARRAGCVIGHDYPAPIVDHAWARERALSAFRAARQAYEGQQEDE